MKLTRREVKYLETHLYAPELNTLHIANTGEEVRVPGIVDIDEAIEFLNEKEK